MSYAKLMPDSWSAPTAVSMNSSQLEQSPSVHGHRVLAGAPPVDPKRSLTITWYWKSGLSEDALSRLAWAMIEATSALVASPYV